MHNAGQAPAAIPNLPTTAESPINTSRPRKLLRRFVVDTANLLQPDHPALVPKLLWASPHWIRHTHASHALDDFGAGYTSFPYLRDLPADALKIDGGFVRDMQELSANAAIVEAIIGLARNLGMQSIAEWVEDAQTLEVLQAMRVDYVQGFAIARPQSPDVILAATSAADFIKDPEVLALIGPRIISPSCDGTSTQALH